MCWPTMSRTVAASAYGQGASTVTGGGVRVGGVRVGVAARVAVGVAAWVDGAGAASRFPPSHPASSSPATSPRTIASRTEDERSWPPLCRTRLLVLQPDFVILGVSVPGAARPPLDDPQVCG